MDLRTFIRNAGIYSSILWALSAGFVQAEAPYIVAEGEQYQLRRKVESGFSDFTVKYAIWDGEAEEYVMEYTEIPHGDGEGRYYLDLSGTSDKAPFETLEFEYEGDGIFSYYFVDDYTYLSAKAGTYFSLTPQYGSTSREGEFEGGYAPWIYENEFSYLDVYGVMHDSGISANISSGSIGVCSNDEHGFCIKYKPLNDADIPTKSYRQYYDYASGKSVIAEPEYAGHGGVLSYEAEDTLVLKWMKGMDDQYYFMRFDLDGNIIQEPTLKSEYTELFDSDFDASSYEKFTDHAFIVNAYDFGYYKDGAIFNPLTAREESDIIPADSHNNCWYDERGNIYYINSDNYSDNLPSEVKICRYDGKDIIDVCPLYSSLPSDELKGVKAFVGRCSFNGEKVWILIQSYMEDEFPREWVLLDVKNPYHPEEILRIPFLNQYFSSSVVLSPNGKIAYYSLYDEETDSTQIYQWTEEQGITMIDSMESWTDPYFIYANDSGYMVYESTGLGTTRFYHPDRGICTEGEFTPSINTNCNAEQFIYSDSEKIYFYSFDMREPIEVCDGSRVSIIAPEDMRYDVSFGYMYNFSNFYNKMIGTDSFDHMCFLVERDDTEQLYYIDDFKNGTITYLDSDIQWGYVITGVGGLVGYNHGMDFYLLDDMSTLIYRTETEEMWKMDLDTKEKELLGKNVLAFNKDYTKVFEQNNDGSISLVDRTVGSSNIVSPPGEDIQYYTIKTPAFNGIAYQEGFTLTLIDFDANVFVKQFPDEMVYSSVEFIDSVRGNNLVHFMNNHLWLMK